MKKVDVLSMLKDHPGVVYTLKNIHRLKIYTLTYHMHSAARRLQNIPLLITHYHKTGIRCKVLANKPSRSRDYKDMGDFIGDTFTIPYTWIQSGAQFKEMDASDMLLFVGCATRYLRGPLMGVHEREYDKRYEPAKHMMRRLKNHPWYTIGSLFP